MRLVLASASARRADALRSIGIAFDAVASGVTEAIPAGQPPWTAARWLALAKARAVVRAHHVAADAAVLGADTIVALDDTPIGKPRDDADAKRTLRRLSGRTHLVTTGVALIARATGQTRVAHAIASVTFHHLSARQIDDYVATGDPRDKAGAYGLQTVRADFVARLDGPADAVVGLPMGIVRPWLAALGVKPT